MISKRLSQTQGASKRRSRDADTSPDSNADLASDPHLHRRPTQQQGQLLTRALPGQRSLSRCPRQVREQFAPKRPAEPVGRRHLRKHHSAARTQSTPSRMTDSPANVPQRQRAHRPTARRRKTPRANLEFRYSS
ncbi:hypothetical protein RESH_06348 [Rhodopirellula europaea SH398]|uniref:Uncharacterized protein n=1 Tax=Rhodopirellula europaea SH398 TaxID=1263868 RepID=M5RUV0_9BACT|nr:hypothetical protein RESH_06348 [Rhodopirellula europaea SH398]